MFWENLGLMFQFLWVAFECLILPVTTVVVLVLVTINIAIKHWELIKYWLQVASRVVSWLFVKLAWLIIRLIDGKKTADKWF
ncbi:hypothetical protein [Weissella bombi]|uniref:hypothetical protein n=1 Tax=Weissella bombi TaxID=1505725 RepID=UPI003AF2E38B